MHYYSMNGGWFQCADVLIRQLCGTVAESFLSQAFERPRQEKLVPILTRNMKSDPGNISINGTKKDGGCNLIICPNAGRSESLPPSGHRE